MLERIKNQFVDSVGRRREENLLMCLYRYLDLKGRLDRTFKVKYFYSKSKYRTTSYPPIYADCPLSKGELCSAIRLGNELHLLINSGNTSFGIWQFRQDIPELEIVRLINMR